MIGTRALRGHVISVAGVAPTFSAAPAIIGTPAVGVACAYTPGTASGYPAPTITRQWTLDGSDIGGATSATYTPVSGDETHALRVREIATNTAGSANSTSASGTVAAAPPGPIWQFPDSGTLTLTAGSPFTLATTVPSGALVSTSPDMLPGQSLSLASSTLSLVNDSTVPTVDSDRDIVIEVLTSPYATINNVTQSITYQPGQSYSTPDSAYPPGRWNKVLYDMAAGDIIEISPGVVHELSTDPINYFSNALGASMLAVTKPGTVRNMAGRGRWGLYADDTFLTSGRGGICIYTPIALGTQGTFVIEGFAFDNYGSGSGVRMMNSVSTNGTWDGMHTAITLRNFKFGKRFIPYTSGRPADYSSSGLANGARTLTIENGHIYDCGGLTAGQDHNAYISAETMIIRGVRSVRSRGILDSSGALTAMDGHIWKVSAVTGTFDGNVCDGSKAGGDMTHHLQMKAGGNWTIRGNLFRDSVDFNGEARGPITMLRETADDGVTPNYEWWAGSAGNTMLVEKNVFVNFYGRPFLSFFTVGQAGYMGPGSAADQISFITVRDNVGMAPTTPTVLAPFDSTKWIWQDPTGDLPWASQNTVVSYDATEAPFNNIQIKGYSLASGAVSASGTVTTKRFEWPHGYVTRTDAIQGLG